MLFVVATPIGNLGDITLRAVEALKSADVIAAEDTRHSGLLLKHLEIKKPFVSYHEHNEAARTTELVERLGRGENVALITDAGMPGLSDPLITDAGMPGLSDPGLRLIRECIKRELPFIDHPRSIIDPDGSSWFRIFHREIFFSRVSACKKWTTRARIASSGRTRRNSDLFRIALPTN